MKAFTFENYREALLEGVGVKTREKLLEQASNDKNIEFQDFLRLCRLASPEAC